MQRKPDMPMGQGSAPAGAGAPMGLGGQPAQQMPAEMENADGMDFAGGGEPATPEEQKQYNDFVNNAQVLAYDEKTQGVVLDAIMGMGDPVMGLANTAATIVLQVEQSAESNGVELAEGVVYNAGAEIVEDLASFVKEAGAHDFTEQEVEAAWFRGIDIYRELKSNAGGIDQDKYQADLAQLIKADQAGQLEQTMPQLTQAAAKQQGKAPMPAGQPGAQPGEQERR